MKVIKEGDKMVGKWWIGWCMECPRCHRTVRLEAGDDRSPFFSQINPDSISLVCENCTNTVTLRRPMPSPE